MERNNDFKTPGVISRKLKPSGLKLVGAKNRQILEKALNYEAKDRPTAEGFLQDLGDYHITDGSTW